MCYILKFTDHFFQLCYVEGSTKVSAAGSSGLGLVVVEACLVVSSCLALPSLFAICLLWGQTAFHPTRFFSFLFLLNDVKNPFSEWVDYYMQRAEGSTEVLWYCWEFKYIHKGWGWGLLVTFSRPWIPFPKTT